MPQQKRITGGIISFGVSAELLERLERVASVVEGKRSEFLRQAVAAELGRHEADQDQATAAP